MNNIIGFLRSIKEPFAFLGETPFGKVCPKNYSILPQQVNF